MFSKRGSLAPDVELACSVAVLLEELACSVAVLLETFCGGMSNLVLRWQEQLATTTRNQEALRGDLSPSGYEIQ